MCDVDIRRAPFKQKKKSSAAAFGLPYRVEEKIYMLNELIINMDRDGRRENVPAYDAISRFYVLVLSLVFGLKFSHLTFPKMTTVLSLLALFAMPIRRVSPYACTA